MSQPLLDSSLPEYVGKPSRAFLSTYWPLVRSAAGSGAERDAALEHLVRQYSPALKQFLQVKFGFDSWLADDCVQGFLVDKVLKRNLMARAQEQNGKFRNLLATSIVRWTIDHLRRENSKKRHPENGVVGIDSIPENELLLTVDDREKFDSIFVRQVLASAVHRLNQYCISSGQTAAWTVFYYRVLTTTLDIGEPKPYSELVEELHLRSVVEARNLLSTAKRIFRRELESVLSEYASDSGEIEEELAELRAILR